MILLYFFRQIIRVPVGVFFLIAAFLLSSFGAYSYDLTTPAAQRLLGLSRPLAPLTLRGVEFNPENLLKLNFVVDEGDSAFADSQFKSDSQRLMYYFLSALTLPAGDLWVNLSPYEQGRVVPQALGAMQMGQDLLQQDYLLKQLAASLTYPETEVGKRYWDEINNVGAAHRGRPGQAQGPAPTNSFQKVWIVPDKAVVYEVGNKALIKTSRLKVLCEADYLAMQNNGVSGRGGSRTAPTKDTDAFKKYILPLIEKEVNSGKNFAPLRQVYNAVILAAWFKKKLKDSVLEQAYFDKKKIAGAQGKDPQAKEKIYQQYVEAFKQGAYNYVKRESVGTRFIASARIIKRQYFSGGADLKATAAMVDEQKVFGTPSGAADIEKAIPAKAGIGVELTPIRKKAPSRKILNATGVSALAHFAVLAGMFAVVEHYAGKDKEAPAPGDRDLSARDAIDVKVQNDDSLDDSIASAASDQVEIKGKPSKPSKPQKAPVHSPGKGSVKGQLAAFADDLWSLDKPGAKPIKFEMAYTRAPLTAASSDTGLAQPTPAVPSSGQGKLRLVRSVKDLETGEVYEEDAEPDSSEPGVSVSDLDSSVASGKDYEVRQVGSTDIYHVAFNDSDKHAQAADRAMVFVEHNIHKGEVLNDDEMDDLFTSKTHLNNDDFGIRRNFRGGNNFTAKNLVDFYNAAAARQVKLNKVEEKLKRDLIQRRIVLEQNGRYFVGKNIAVVTSLVGAGADGSVALRHELGHGLYETDSEYHAAVQKIWSSLPANEREVFENILTWLDYHRGVFATEFAEYLSDPDLFQDELKKIYADAAIYSPGQDTDAQKRKIAGAVVAKVAEHRSAEETGSMGGFYLKKDFAKRLSQLSQKIRKAKADAAKRNGIKGLAPVGYGGSFGKALHVDQGPLMSFAQKDQLEGDYNSLKKNIADSKYLTAEKKQAAQKGLKRLLERHGWESIFNVAISSDGTYSLEYVRRKSDVVPVKLADKVGKAFAGVDSSDIRDYTAKFKDFLISEGQDFSDEGGFSLTREVNLGGEKFTMVVQGGVTTVQYGNGPEEKRFDVRIAVKDNKFHALMYAYPFGSGSSGKSMGEAFQEAWQRFQSEASWLAIDLAPVGSGNYLTLDQAIERVQKAWAQSADRDNHFEIYKRISIGERIYGVHVVQHVTDRLEGKAVDTRIGLEGSDGQVINGIGVKVEGKTRKEGLAAAVEQFKEKLNTRSLPKASGAARSTALVISADSEHYGEITTRDIGGKAYTAAELKDGTVLVDAGLAHHDSIPVTVVTKSGKQTLDQSIILDNDMSKEEAAEALQLAVNANNGDASKMPKNLVFAYFSRSQHPGENHTGDGLVGLNEVTKNIANAKARVITRKMLLFHELCHEAFGQDDNPRFEAEQLARDVAYVTQLLKEQAMSVEDYVAALSQAKGLNAGDFLAALTAAVESGQTAGSTRGGVDLNEKILDLQVEKGTTQKIPSARVSLDLDGLQGFIPVIVRVNRSHR